MEAIAHSLHNFADSVIDAFTPKTVPTTAQGVQLSLAEIQGLEETERTRRLEQVVQSRIDQSNAAHLSVIIKGQAFPVFRGLVSKGYKRVTTKWEEDERRRRLTNKSESALRRANANKTARMIQELGWPFYRQYFSGPEYIIMDATAELEEEERIWRTRNSFWAATAKHNASVVANILRWNNFQKNPTAGSRRFARILEEKERRSRLYPDVFNLQMENGYREAALIRHLGSPFYVQAEDKMTLKLSELNKLEEAERARRMRYPAQEQLAHELAGIVSEALHPVLSDKILEESERGRRLADQSGQRLAQSNARQVSLLVRESSLNKIHEGPMWFSISRNSMRALEEIERTRRLRDFQGQQLAKLRAKQLSELFITGLNTTPRSNLSTLEEEERQARTFDRTQQLLAQKNARKVSGLIAKHFLANNSEEAKPLLAKERRVSYEQFVAPTTAPTFIEIPVAAPAVASRSVAPIAPAQSTTMITTLTKSSSLVATGPAASVPLSTSVPVAPLSAPISTQMPLPRQTSFTTTTVQPSPILAAPIPPVSIQSAPIAPIMSTPIQATPIQSAPIAPIMSTPIQATPIAPVPIQSAPIAPIMSTPIQATPIALVPIQSAPIQQSFSQSTMQYTAPIAPLQSATILPTSQAPYTTVTSAPISYAVPADNLASNAQPLLGERERKKLAKEADKHNRKSEKDIRKAESRRIKAEKMHQKGRDDKAMKLEGKADYLVQLAEHERKWASGIQNELLNQQGLGHNTPAPASM